MEDDAKEVNVPVNATHLRAVTGGKAETWEEGGVGISEKELESLFRQYHDRVFRAAYRITGSIVDAEDVLQTVFLRLSRRGNLDLEPNPGSYLHRAAINGSLDLVRQRGRSVSIPIDDILSTAPGDSRLNPETQRRSGELRVAIRKAIGKLGEKSAEMFVMKYFEGYSNQEIAEAMGTSPMVVGVLLHRARARVKKEVGDFIEGGPASRY